MSYYIYSPSKHPVISNVNKTRGRRIVGQGSVIISFSQCTGRKADLLKCRA